MLSFFKQVGKEFDLAALVEISHVTVKP